MRTLPHDISTVHRVARRLEEDIQRRGLGPGDRYLTAYEAAEMFEISRPMAQRALKLLSDSQKLLRRCRLGTFVGPQMAAVSAPKMQTMFVLGPEALRLLILDRYIDILKIVGDEIHCTNINYGFIPETEGVAYVRQLLASSIANGTVIGILAVSCPHEIYKFLADTGMPTAVYGSVYYDTPNLPSLDLDNREAGRILTAHLTGRGHRRIAVLATNRGRPGDHDFIEGVTDALTTAGLPPNALILRIAPHTRDSCRHEVRRLLKSTNRPTGLIVRGEHMVSAAHAAVVDMGLDIPSQLDLVFQMVSPNALEDRLPYPHASPKYSGEKSARLLAKMLVMPEGNQAESKRVIVPVELRNARDDGTRLSNADAVALNLPELDNSN